MFFFSQRERQACLMRSDKHLQCILCVKCEENARSFYLTNLIMAKRKEKANYKPVSPTIIDVNLHMLLVNIRYNLQKV
jgi:hypothetical protein